MLGKTSDCPAKSWIPTFAGNPAPTSGGCQSPYCRRKEILASFTSLELTVQASVICAWLPMPGCFEQPPPPAEIGQAGPGLLLWPGLNMAEPDTRFDADTS